MRNWIYVAAAVFSLGSILLTLALTGPRPVDHDLVKVGMTREEVERILPTKNWTCDDAATLCYFESGVAVRYQDTYVNGRVMKTTAVEVQFVDPKPRSYLTRLLDLIF
jgi:hypothetical protein